MPENFDRELSGGTAGRESYSGPPDLQIHVESGVADSLGWVELHRLLTLRPGVPLRDVPDRVTFSFPEDAPTWIVKRTRGDLRREAWFDRLHGSGGRSPGAREFENLQGLSEAGIPVPRPLAWASRSDVSLVVMERVSHESDLREVLARGGEATLRRWFAPLLDLVVRMHRAGWYHRDLYLQHFLPAARVGERGEALCLIDVGRARCQARPRLRWFLKDLGALLHSAPPQVPRSWCLRFLAAYLDSAGVEDRTRRRRWARSVERRRARIAGHVPRHGEAGPGSDS